MFVCHPLVRVCERGGHDGAEEDLEVWCWSGRGSQCSRVKQATHPKFAHVANGR